MWSQENDLEQQGLDLSPQPFLILSGDYDFAQLQRYRNVQQFSPIHKKWVTAEGNIDELLMEHILQGDKGDSVPNFLSDDDTFVAGGRQKPLKKKDLEEWKKLPMTHWETTPYAANVVRNANMIDLRNIPEDIRVAIIHSYVSQKGVKNKSQLLNYFVANKMTNLIEHITEF
jgi:hypothetical protein